MFAPEVFFVMHGPIQTPGASVQTQNHLAVSGTGIPQHVDPPNSYSVAAYGYHHPWNSQITIAMLGVNDSGSDAAVAAGIAAIPAWFDALLSQETEVHNARLLMCLNYYSLSNPVRVAQINTALEAEALTRIALGSQLVIRDLSAAVIYALEVDGGDFQNNLHLTANAQVNKIAPIIVDGVTELMLGGLP